MSELDLNRCGSRTLAWAFSTLIVLSGCAPSAVAPVTGDEPTELRLQVGDHLRVVTKYRDRMTIRVVEIRPDALVGVTLEPRQHESRPPGEEVTIPYGDLAMLERFRVTRARGAGTAAAGVMVLVAGLYVLTTNIPPPMGQ